ncbi:MAG: DUF3572 domain-containing protein [Sphingobium sp.]
MVALQAISWIVSDTNRAGRFLSLTGLDPEELRAGLGNDAVLAAALDYLLGHEADLMAYAEAIGESPETIVAARAQVG